MGMRAQASATVPESDREHTVQVALLTGGGDKPYVFSLTQALVSKGAALDLIGSDELDFVELRGRPGVTFLNLRGSVRPDVTKTRKILRISVYYARLLWYAARSRPELFHVLWNNKFEHLDRTLLMLYYRLLGKQVALTAHNVDAGRRDNSESRLNRLTLRIQYGLSDVIFVHTERMKRELIEEFGVNPARITVIPFGMNTSLPDTPLTPADAKQRLGIGADERAILFFGNITPYKGLEYLVEAFHELLRHCDKYRLIIAGNPTRCESYWKEIRNAIAEDVRSGRVLLRADFIPDEDAEVYFKAADVFVLPYKHIYQSGVLFTGYNFGLPVLAADVGSLKDDIVEGKTGFVFRPEDPIDLARTIETFFSSDMYINVNSQRLEIRDYIARQHSWDVVAHLTMEAYADVLGRPVPQALSQV
jgi:D-inositol-3-phosphate glycosyltransferase